MSYMKELLLEIYELFDYGYSNEEIAKELDCSLNLVESARRMENSEE